MTYLTQTFDPSLLQFGPATGKIKEISLRTVLSLLASGDSYWMPDEHSTIKELLRASEHGSLFEKVQDLQVPDVVGINADDTILVIAHTPDCHLFVGEIGFRFFRITMKASKIETLDEQSGQMLPVATE